MHLFLQKNEECTLYLPWISELLETSILVHLFAVQLRLCVFGIRTNFTYYGHAVTRGRAGGHQPTAGKSLGTKCRFIPFYRSM